MSGYLSRLIHLTGIVVPGAEESAPGSPLASEAAPLERESVQAVDTADAPQPVLNAEIGPHAAHAGGGAIATSSEGSQPALGPPRISAPESIVEPLVEPINRHDAGKTVEERQPEMPTVEESGEDVPRRATDERAAPPMIESLSRPSPGLPDRREVRPARRARDEPAPHAAAPTADRARSYGDVFAAVRAWVAERPTDLETPDEPAVPFDTRRAETAPADRIDLIRPFSREPVPEMSAAVPELSISIGTISVTIEAPAQSPAPAPVAARRAEPRRDRDHDDHLRFRRHYLRR